MGQRNKSFLTLNFQLVLTLNLHKFQSSVLLPNAWFNPSGMVGCKIWFYLLALIFRVTRGAFYQIRVKRNEAWKKTRPFLHFNCTLLECFLILCGLPYCILTYLLHPQQLIRSMPSFTALYIWKRYKSIFRAKQKKLCRDFVVYVVGIAF